MWVMTRAKARAPPLKRQRTGSVQKERAEAQGVFLALTQVLARISDVTRQRAGSNGGGRGQEHLRLFMAHAPRKIPVGGADAFKRRVHPAERVHWPAEAGRASGVLSHLDAATHENFPNRLIAPASALQVVDNFRRGRNSKRVYS